MSEAEKRACLHRLEELKRPIDELTCAPRRAPKGRSRLNGAAKERAQEQLASIKAALGCEYRRLGYPARRGQPHRDREGLITCRQ